MITGVSEIELHSSFACIILDRGLPDSYPRKVQLIQPARLQDLELAKQDTESLYESRLATAAAPRQPVKPSRQRTGNSSNMLTPNSQLSYKAMTPRADRLPSSLTLQKDQALSKSFGKISPHEAMRSARSSNEGSVKGGSRAGIRQTKPTSQRTSGQSRADRKSTSQTSTLRPSRK